MEKYKLLLTEWHASHSARQAYIALGVTIIASAEQRVDATSMEDFIPDAGKVEKVRTPKEIFVIK